MSLETLRPTYRVRQHYRYVYTAPIWDVKQRLVMVPPDRHADQELLAHDLEVRGATGPLSISWQSDRFGNRVCHVEAARVEHALDFEAWFSVCRGAPSAHDAWSDLLPYLAFTGLTSPDSSILAAARAIQAEASARRAQVDLAHDWSARSIAYQVGVTGTQTPAAMALHLGQGVCQDYAHIMLSLLRTLGIPARYVSGHLLGEGAPHAWVEVLVGDARGAPPSVLALDPTHHREAGHNYITVAVGRDFADVTATSGVFSGAGTGKLHWSKQAERVDPGGGDTVAEFAA